MNLVALLINRLQVVSINWIITIYITDINSGALTPSENTLTWVIKSIGTPHNRSSLLDICNHAVHSFMNKTGCCYDVACFGDSNCFLYSPS